MLDEPLAQGANNTGRRRQEGASSAPVRPQSTLAVSRTKSRTHRLWPHRRAPVRRVRGPPRKGGSDTSTVQPRSDFVVSNGGLTASLSRLQNEGNGVYSVTALLNPPSLGHVQAVVRVDGTSANIFSSPTLRRATRQSPAISTSSSMSFGPGRRRSAVALRRREQWAPTGPDRVRPGSYRGPRRSRRPFAQPGYAQHRQFAPRDPLGGLMIESVTSPTAAGSANVPTSTRARRTRPRAPRRDPGRPPPRA